jgi:3',5'-cyclic AMP phosphodiesterase CpdA
MRREFEFVILKRSVKAHKAGEDRVFGLFPEEKPTMPRLSRRDFLARTTAASATVAGITTAAKATAPAPAAAPWSFALLGDTHFDKLEHHDFQWLAAEHPGDVEQIKRYSAHAASLLPELLATLKAKIRAAKKTAGEAAAPIERIVHVGDFVEGLCGTSKLAERHVDDAIEFVERAELDAPLLLTKGNHDVTGPGAVEAYEKRILPFLGRQLNSRAPEKARYAVEHRGAKFAMFDAYDKASLDWLKETLGRTRRGGPTFVVVHQPIIPFQARGNWSLYIKPEQAATRRELLNLLGEHRAIVLCGHVHRYGFTVRESDNGPFAQLCVSSILSARDEQPKQLLEGIDAYGPDLTELEPKFQPESKAVRRKIFVDEKPLVRHFEYADAAGHAVLRIDGPRVTADVCLGTSSEPWRTIELTPS